MTLLEYRIRFNPTSGEIEVQGDKEFVEKKFQKLLEFKKGEKTTLPHATRETTTFQPTSSTARPLTLNEFIRDVNIKSHPQRILLYAYWLEHYKYLNDPRWTLKDLVDCYNQTRVNKSPDYISGNLGPRQTIDRHWN